MIAVKFIRSRIIRRATYALLVICLLPGAANATQIQLTGMVDTVSTVFGTAPFAVGDPLSGSFNVRVDPGNNFGLADLDSFNLRVGPADFDLSQADFGSFNGSIAADGTLSNLALVTSFLSVPGLTEQYALGFNGVDQPFSVTGFTSITSGSFSGRAVAEVNDVPEPSSLVLFALALVATGLGVARGKKARLPRRLA